LTSSDGTAIDDRTTKARIRDAAIVVFAEHGVAGTTARRVAESAGVSPGSVIHHYGSMEGLRTACDQYVAAVIRHRKEEAMSAGVGLDVLAALRENGVGSLAGYLSRVLVDDSPIVERLVDELVHDAGDYTQQGIDAGLLQPTDDARSRAAVLTLWSLGALVLHRHVKRILGVDLTNPEVGSSSTMAAYAGPAYEVLGRGIFTDEFAAHLRDAVAEMANSQDQEQTTPLGRRSVAAPRAPKGRGNP
jgi:AcrR family transcriptional regulator